MDFKYTIDSEADEPIMMIDSHIGRDDIDGDGIMGNEFVRELLFLDTLNKTKIHVWINSPGGSVVDGEAIFGAILKTKTKVDTHCFGIAASIAFPIFLAGRSRYMMDYAKLMTHPVHGGSDPKTMAAFEDTVVKMISTRSLISEDLVKQLMKRTTWIFAKDAEELGLCEVEDSGNLNKKRVASNDWKDYKYIKNVIIEEKKPKKNISMKGIANKLNLNEEASENAIVQEIDKLKNSANASNEALNKAQKELEEAANKYNEMKDKLDKLTNEMNSLNEAKNRADLEATNAKKAEIATKTEALIKEGVKVGRIQNEVKAIESWKAKFESDFDGTKALLDSIPASKEGAKITNHIEAVDNKKSLTAVVSNEMHEIRNRLKLN